MLELNAKTTALVVIDYKRHLAFAGDTYCRWLIAPGSWRHFASSQPVFLVRVGWCRLRQALNSRLIPPTKCCENWWQHPAAIGATDSDINHQASMVRFAVRMGAITPPVSIQ